MYEVKVYDFQGYDAFFDDIMPEIYHLIQGKSGSEESDEFMAALTEAVCNAAMYSPGGLDNAKICMNLILTDEAIKITVISDSPGFDVERYQLRLKSLALSEQGAWDWQQYVGTTQQGRGLWLMISFFDAVIIGDNGREITVIARLPLKLTEVNTISKIVHKLFISINGVIT